MRSTTVREDIIIIPPDEKFQWYILFVSSNKEFRVRDLIIRLENQRIRQVFIPYNEAGNNNKQSNKTELLFSNYVFILADLDEKTYELIHGIEGVFCFLGVNNKNDSHFQLPYYLTADEIDRIEQCIKIEKQAKNSTGIKFKVGDYVRITHGIFENLKGYIKEIRNNIILIDLEDDLMKRNLIISLVVDKIEKVS